METINHVLFHCDRATQMWEAAGLPSPPSGFGECLHGNVAFVFQQLEGNNTQEHCESISWVLWSICKSRNKMLFARIQESVNSTIQRAFEETKCWFEIHHGESVYVQASLGTYEAEHIRHKPELNIMKCNLHGNWRNSTLQSGGSWIARDCSGSVLFHSRDAFTSSPNRIMAEFRVLIWAMQSLRDLHVRKVIFALDYVVVNDALLKPLAWPRYRGFIEQVFRLVTGFDSVSFHLETPKANRIAREIFTSVTRDGRFHSYIAWGGPTLLQNLIARSFFLASSALVIGCDA